MKTYTVILLRPDYIAGTFGQDTYMTSLEAESVEDAEKLAQMEAFELDIPQEDRGDYDDDASDGYFVIAVIEGTHMDIKTW